MATSTATNLVKVNFYGEPANKKDRDARVALAKGIEQLHHEYMCTADAGDVIGIELYPLTASEEAELDAA